MGKILIIDDEATILNNLQFVLELEDFKVLKALSYEEGIYIYKANKKEIDVVITDMRMPKKNGIDILKEIKLTSPEMEVIIFTGHGDMENAILAMKEGAFEYLTKPVNAEELIISISNAKQKIHLVRENRRMQSELLDQNYYLNNLTMQAEKALVNYQHL